MKMRVLFGLFACAALASLAAAYVEFRQSTSVYYGHAAAGWEKRGRAADHELVSLVFAIKQRNVDKLEQILLEVSNPKSPQWGKFLSLNEIGDLTADYASTNAVQAWLRGSGVGEDSIDITVNGDWIKAVVPARLAEQLLACEFYHFHHAKSGATALRTDLYRLPLAVADRVDFVGHTVSAPQPRPSPIFRPLPAAVSAAMAALSGSGSNSSSSSSSPAKVRDVPAGYVGPSTVSQVYSISSNVVASAKATQSVYENLGQSYDPADLSSFDSQMGVPAQTISQVIGPNTPSACTQDPNNCVEADLDVEYLTGVAQNSPTTYWSIANGDNQPFLDWILAVANATNPPLVHSISYGDVEQDDDPTTMTRFNTEVMKLGARGVSVIVASGDDGVANFPARSDPTQCGFFPSFPASAPYVTAVGATQGPENGTAEVACTSATGGGITTGGGFSTVFTAPSYQTAATQAYLTNGPSLPPSSAFNPSGRGYPDVAMMGHNYLVQDGGQLGAGSGTSASAPVFAACITLVNGLRIQAGKAPLGFLNQILYQLAASTPAAFNDITSGENNCCAGDPGSQTCCQYGFTATTGWDPLTGLGSINFPAFSQALLNLP